MHEIVETEVWSLWDQTHRLRRFPGRGHSNPFQYLPGESHGQRTLEPGGLWSIKWHRVRHDWSNLVSVCACMCVHVCMCVHTCMYICACVCMHMCMCVHTGAHVCACVHVCVCTCLYSRNSLSTMKEHNISNVQDSWLECLGVSGCVRGSPFWSVL